MNIENVKKLVSLLEKKKWPKNFVWSTDQNFGFDLDMNKPYINLEGLACIESLGLEEALKLPGGLSTHGEPTVFSVAGAYMGISEDLQMALFDYIDDVLNQDREYISPYKMKTYLNKLIKAHEGLNALLSPLGLDVQYQLQRL